MGRTWRRRKVKRANSFQTCNYVRDLIMFNSWLSKSGIQRSKKLVLSMFSDCNRGVLTKKRINAGDELLSLPLNLTINVTTLLMDEKFCAIFLESNQQTLLQYNQAISFQCMLAFYLLYLKVQGKRSKWHLYLESLPNIYTVPYFLSKEIKCFLDPNIELIISKQAHNIDKAYASLIDILSVTKCQHKSVQMLKTVFNKLDFEWAYFTVNTRCVFMDLTNLLNQTPMQSTLLNIISDTTKIALCPFLDMINHSVNAKNETKLKVNKELDRVPVGHLKESSFAKVSFSIYTKTNFEAYSQVFICYGDSYNLKLVTEYGFYLPSNNLDYVPLEYEQIVTFLDSVDRRISQDQVNYIMKHGLNKELYIDLTGMSFNLYGLLFVVKYYHENNINISNLLYSAAVSSYNSDLIDLIKPFLNKKILSSEYCLSNLKKFHECVTLNNCVLLMCQYIKILEKFINS